MKSDEHIMLELETEPLATAEETDRDAADPISGEPDQQESSRWRRLGPWFGGAFVGGIAALLLAFGLVSSLRRGEHAAPAPSPGVATSLAPEAAARARALGNVASFTASQRAELAKHQELAQMSSNLENDAAAATPEAVQGTSPAALPVPPMILRTAQITLIAQNLDKARAETDQIVQRFGGYVGELSTTAPSEGPRRLTATLRVPAARLDAALAELKALGRIESESQTGQDVTAQYVDLEARLSNARNTEQRLLELLRQRTGKLSDVLEVETELSRVREEVERMEGERRLLSKQVEFSTITATLTEEYKAPGGPLPDSVGMRFRNAAVEGYQSVVNFFLGIALFLLADGLMLLIWAGILFYPARWAWRRLRAH